LAIGTKTKITLTFDDGPSPVWTEKILDLLEQLQLKAIFFMVGKQAEKYPQIVKKVIDGGHQIGNHSWSHIPLFLLPRHKILNEIEKTHHFFQKKFGYTISLFRPPWGAVSKKIIDEAKEQYHYKTLFWDIDSLDYLLPVSHPLRFNKNKRSQIVLFHDGAFYSPMKNKEHTLKMIKMLYDQYSETFKFDLPFP
jgi:peptidoglycan/xylan/chitin deacetylase (PgdA/CDA1 family)